MKRFCIPCLLAILIFSWQACTKAVVDDGDSGPIEEIVKYDPDVKAVMETHCVGCHSGELPSGGLLLDDYNTVRLSTEDGNLVARMNDLASPMPPAGLISSSQREIINKWITDGYLEE